MRPSDIEIVIITVDRSPDYLAQTLASLFMSDPRIWEVASVRVVVGSPEIGYLRDLHPHPRLEFDLISEADWEGIRRLDIFRRLGHTLCRALSLPARATGGRCIIEDDMIFCDGFVSKLTETVAEIGRARAGDYVLAAYSPMDYAGDRRRRKGRFYCTADALTHYGCCCLYYPNSVLQRVAAYIRKSCVESGETAADLAVGKFAHQLLQEGHGGLYQTISSLAQHVGRVSGGTSDRYYCSPTFGRLWPRRANPAKP